MHTIQPKKVKKQGRKENPYALGKQARSSTNQARIKVDILATTTKFLLPPSLPTPGCRREV